MRTAMMIPKEGLLVRALAEHLDLWAQISAGVRNLCGEDDGRILLHRLATIRVRESFATSRLGSYVFCGKDPVCIRLQFAQEEDCLRQTFLHEISHACDHLHRGWERGRRFGHGSHWRQWAQALGIDACSTGRSSIVAGLHQRRNKLVAVCQQCGTEFYRVRRLNRKGKYIHPACGGTLLPL